jgi:hypothetical protein
MLRTHRLLSFVLVIVFAAGNWVCGFQRGLHAHLTSGSALSEEISLLITPHLSEQLPGGCYPVTRLLPPNSEPSWYLCPPLDGDAQQPRQPLAPSRAH